MAYLFGIAIRGKAASIFNTNGTPLAQRFDDNERKQRSLGDPLAVLLHDPSDMAEEMETLLHRFVGDAVVRGPGAPVEKSMLFPSLSWQPASFRIAAVVFVSAGVAVASKQFAPS